MAERWDADRPAIMTKQDNGQWVWFEDFDQLRAKVSRLEEAVALLNSMVLSGEQHSETSKKVIEQALTPEKLKK